MQRRRFIKNTLAGATGMIILPSFATINIDREEDFLSELEKNFITPPPSARPWVFWMWMNGNITKEGITLDLETMKTMGIGGVINFNSAVGIPRGPVDYAGEEWMEATAHAVREAQRLGIDMTIHNSPGYSGCGGPWVTPEMSMQELVWTETRISGNGQRVNIQLPRPYAKYNYYQDAFVIAYPSLPVEKALMKDKLARVRMNGNEIDKNILTDNNPDTKIRIEADGLSIVLEFIEPFEARAISMLRKPEIPRDLFDGPRDLPPVINLQSSNDGINYTAVGTIRCPELRAMDTPAALSFAAVSATYFRLVFSSPSWLCDVQLHNGPRLGGWPGKTSYTHGDSNGETPGVTDELIIDPSKVIDLSDKLNTDGSLAWNAPAGNWTILRIGHTTTGEEPAAHPDAGKGLEIDKFNKQALDFHFNMFLDKFLDKIKPNIGKSFKGITVDSWEAGKQNWTVNFPAEFNHRKSYQIASWMPALTGRIVGSIDETERFLWDVRKVQADLLSENFYGHFANECHKRGLIFNGEPYGDGNFDSLQVNQHLDTPMAEFWTRYIYGSDIYSIQAASAAHIFGKKLAAAEAFTGMPATSKWTDYPYSLKAEGDYFYTIGINRLVFHTFVHQPYTTGLPGMTMGPFGTHFDRNNTWSNHLASAWTGYLTRTQYMLQQGLTVTDICYFKGDNPESGVPDIHAFLPKGYAGDVIGAEALQERCKIKDGMIQLPDGMQYRVCMMAPLESILPSSMSRIKELVADGMTLIVQSKPLKSYGLAKNDEILNMANSLYGALNGTTVTEGIYGKGKIFWGKPLDAILQQLNIQPDFVYTAENQDATIHYIHKYIDETEYYFVTNHKRRRENIVCSFRTSGKSPELWDPENGSMANCALYQITDGITTLPLQLEPAGSVIVVFRKKNLKEGYKAVVRDGKELITDQPYPSPKMALYTGVQNNFTISMWAKPDTFAHAGRSMLFHAPQGEVVYGSGHAAVALGAGQNGVRVYERGKGNARVVLEANHFLEGWTHLALLYKDGTPSIFINGAHIATGKASTTIVHPGLKTPAILEQFSTYFEGNYTMPELYNESLSSDMIMQLYQKGLPPPELPASIDITQNNNGKIKALIWQNGTYSLKGSNTLKALGQITGCTAINLEGPWRVRFQKHVGAPDEITLPSLIPLHKHSDFNIKHFSGTATYLKTITLSKTDLQPGRKIFLDAGRVEVVATVKVNGKHIGILWKEPFRIDISKAIVAGTNNLEIAVTNLWPNRLIGDESLPQEYEYSEHRFIKKLPEWYVNNTRKPGERVTFTVWKNFEKTDPLLESGLLGPVRIITAIEKTV